MSISAIISLAQNLRDEGDLANLVAMSANYLKKLEQVSEREYSNTITLMNNLAAVLQNRGNFSEAAAIQKAALERLERTPGDNDIDSLTAAVMNNLADTLRKQGELVEAARIQRRVIQNQERIHGKEHHFTVVAMNNLAWTLKEQGRLQEAMSMQVIVLDIRRRTLGKEHTSTLIAMNNLAGTLASCGRTDEAVVMQEEVLVMRQRILGSRHPDTIVAISNLALTLLDQGKLGAAALMQVEALEKNRLVLGQRHPTTVTALYNLALTFARLGSLEEAAKMFKEVLEVRGDIFGDEHESTISAKIDLAKILHRQGKSEEALDLFDEVLTKWRQDPGDNLYVVVIESFVASLRGAFVDALALQASAFLQFKENFGDGHPKAVELLNEVSSMMLGQGGNDEITKSFQTEFQKLASLVSEQVPVVGGRLVEDHSGDEERSLIPDIVEAMDKLVALIEQSQLDEAAGPLQTLEKQKETAEAEGLNKIIRKASESYRRHTGFFVDFALSGDITQGPGNFSLHLIDAQLPRSSLSRFQAPRIGRCLIFRGADVRRPQLPSCRLGGEGSKKTFLGKGLAPDGAANGGLCQACQKITLEGLGCSSEMVSKLIWVEEYRPDYDLDEIHGYQYPHTVGDLDDLYRQCTLCCLIRGAIYHDGDPLTVVSRDRTSRFKVSFFMQNGTGCLKIHLGSATNQEFNAQKNAAPILLRLFSDPENEASFAHLSLSRAIVAPNSDVAFSRLKTSLQDCLSNHPSCARTLSGTVVDEEKTLPTRIIDIGLGHASHARIRETAGLRGKYVALSYCWGQSLGFPDMKLTKTTLQQLKQDLPLEKLPKTIQDAFVITRKLGMRYIWVDRFCIVQDDPADWKSEAAKMASVYENAVFTIAAVGAHTPEQGCFLPREDYKARTATFSTDGGDLHISRLLAPVDKELRSREFELEMSTSSWATRAWTFQERLFSRRAIYFGKQQITWECRKHRETETGFGFDAGFRYPGSKFLYTQDPKSTINRMVEKLEKASANRERIDLSKTWTAENGLDLESLIAMYSQLRLTYEKDRAPAIQSLMQRVAESSGLECLAATWLGSLPNSLFWWPVWWDEGEIERGIFPRRMFRRPENQVPSWSWLVAGCPVSFYSWIQTDKMTLAQPQFIHDEPPKLQCLAYITDELRSSGAREPMLIKSFHEKWNDFPDSHSNGLLDRWEGTVYDLIAHQGSTSKGQSSIHGLVCFDDPENPPESFKCAILGAGGEPVSINGESKEASSNDNLHIFMLALEPTAVLDEYRRIGVAYRHVSTARDFMRDSTDRRLIGMV